MCYSKYELTVDLVVQNDKMIYICKFNENKCLGADDDGDLHLYNLNENPVK